jgi:chitinase
MRPLALWPVWLLSSTQTWAQTNVSNHTLPNIPSNGSALYVPLFEKHSNSTPKFINSTGQTANPLIKALQAKGQGSHKRSILDTNHAHAGSHHGTHRRYHVHHLEQRAGGALPEGTCAPGTPCVNGACCSNKGLCGYTPNECGIGNCISNCNATAPCGQYAKPEDRNCPLNVCCSFFGFCGSTSEFCTSSGERPCQKGYGTCGDAPRPTCGGDSTSQRVVGYYEGW